MQILERLREEGYSFVTPTPLTHGRVISRSDKARARDLRDVLGWNLPFTADLLDPSLFALLQAADMIAQEDGLCRARLRVSSLDNDLYLHSAYPTEKEDAVFFGPDSYRFAELIIAELQGTGGDVRHIVDIGTGAGVGGIVAAKRCPAAHVTMTDINAAALGLARLNATAAGVEAELLLDDSLDQVSDPIDLALANPPYLIDHGKRQYRDGGGMHGGAVALDMARMAVARLAPGGRLILYTGSAIVDGQDALREALDEAARQGGCTLRYREIDPDMFGEELARNAYADVERIAVVAAIMTRAR